MKKIFNCIFSFIKIPLLLFSLGIVMFIMFSMYSRLGKNYLDCIYIIIPYFLLFFTICINYLFNQKVVNNSLFYNITCDNVFLVIIFVSLRCIFDKNMILNEISGFNMNFSYFNDFIVFLKIMLYGLFIGNIVLSFYDYCCSKKGKKQEIEIL